MRPFRLLACTALISGCTAGQLVSTPLWLVDGAVAVATLGVVYPGLGMTTETLIDDGEFRFRGGVMTEHLGEVSQELGKNAEMYGQMQQQKRSIEQASQSSTYEAPQATAHIEPETPQYREVDSSPRLAADRAVTDLGSAPQVASNSPSRPAGEDAKHCVDIRKNNQTGVQYLVNTCHYTIEVRWCAEAQCSARGWNMATVRPSTNQRGLPLSNPGSNRVLYYACKGSNSIDLTQGQVNCTPGMRL